MFGTHLGEVAESAMARTTRRAGDAAGWPRKISHRAAPSAAVTSAPKITWLSREIDGTPISVKVPPLGASSPTVAILISAPSAPLAQIVEVRSVAGAALSGFGPGRRGGGGLAFWGGGDGREEGGTGYPKRARNDIHTPPRKMQVPVGESP